MAAPAIAATGGPDLSDDMDTLTPLAAGVAGIVATIGGPVPDPASWAELVRLGGNAFMDPVALAAATETGSARIVTLCAWAGEQLVGFWALRITRPLPFLPLQLEALPYDYAFLSTPVIAPHHGQAVMASFLAAIAQDRRLPSSLWLKDFDIEGPAFAGLAPLPQVVVRTLDRPVVSRDFGVRRSGSTRKKLRQDWNRLCAAGAAELINDRDSQSALAGLDIFFALEAASWKGARGTALASKQEDTRFARKLVGDMAAKGDASVALLLVDGKAIAAQVVLYSGTTAYTWKIAHDDEWARFSPGALLVDKLTEALLAGEIDLIDSCALDSGFMGRLWEGRKHTADLVVSAGLRPGPGFAVAVRYRQLYQWLRQQRWRWRERRARPRSA